MNNADLDHLSRSLGAGTPRRTATGALALGGLAALTGLQAATARDRRGKVAAAKKKKGKRGPTGPTGPAGAGGGGGGTGPTGPTGATGPSAGAVLGNVGRSAFATLSPGETKTVEVRCPDNTATEDHVASGGGFVAFINEVHIIANHATLDGLGWSVQARNNATQTVTVESWVMCLRTSTGS